MIRTTLEPHQVEGVEFISPKRFGLLGFKTGKGKSLTLLAALHKYIYRTKHIAVLFAPKNAINKVWIPEIKKHTDLQAVLMEDYYSLYQNGIKPPIDIILVRYSHVVKYKDFLKIICKDRITAYDEAHKLKNSKAKMTQAIMECTKESKAKWGLTATAILNSIMDLYGIMEFFEPRIFGTEWDFKRKFCVMEQKVIGRKKNGDLKKAWEIIDYQNLGALKRIRGKWLMVMDSDVNVNYHKIFYDMAPHEEEIYLRAAKGILIEEGRNWPNRIPDLQRVVDGSRDLTGRPSTNINNKFIAFFNKMKEVLDRKESLILFAEYYDSFDLLYECLHTAWPALPIYRMSGRGIEDPVKFPCIVLSTGAGAESLNFGFANHVFFYSIPFSIGIFIQALGRITRMDSEFLENLNCYVPYNETNVDYYKYLLLEYNADLINEVLGKDSNLPPSIEKVRKDLIVKMRKSLLWRIKALK